MTGVIIVITCATIYLIGVIIIALYEDYRAIKEIDVVFSRLEKNVKDIHKKLERENIEIRRIKKLLQNNRLKKGDKELEYTIKFLKERGYEC